MVARRKEKEHRLWNAVAVLLFVLLCAISMALIFSYGRSDLENLGFFDLAVLGLATLRVIHLITYDRNSGFRACGRDGQRRWPTQDRRTRLAPSGLRADAVPLVCRPLVSPHCRDSLLVRILGSPCHTDIGGGRLGLAIASPFQGNRWGPLITLNWADGPVAEQARSSDAFISPYRVLTVHLSLRLIRWAYYACLKIDPSASWLGNNHSSRSKMALRFSPRFGFSPVIRDLASS